MVAFFLVKSNIYMEQMRVSGSVEDSFSILGHVQKISALFGHCTV